MTCTIGNSHGEAPGAGRGGLGRHVDWRGALLDGALEATVDLVAQQLEVDRADLGLAVGGRRVPRKIAFAGQVVRYLMNVELDLPRVTVARTTGCNRSTITHGNHLVEDLRDDAALDRMLDALADAVRLQSTFAFGRILDSSPAPAMAAAPTDEA